MRNLLKKYVIAGIAVLSALMAAPALGATVSATGGTFDGWLITPSVGISLTAETPDSSKITLTKQVSFSQFEGAAISFTQVAADAATNIAFESETVVNNTGAGWGGFQFLLANPSPAAAVFIDNATSPFAFATGYTGGTFADDNIVYSGSQTNGATVNWGGDNHGELTLTATPSRIGTTFNLIEIPLTSAQVADAGTGGIPLTSQTTQVPLPSAVRMGLIGLVSLGLLTQMKILRNKLAK